MTITVIILIFVLLLRVHDSKSLSAREYDSVYDLHPEQRLELSAEKEQKSIQVDDTMDCIFACNSIHWCLSINFKTTPLANGQHVCELLASVQFLNGTSMKVNQNYRHYSTKDPCVRNPCQNDGKCIYLTHIQDYTCNCKSGFYGKNCEVSGGLGRSKILTDHGNSSYLSALNGFLTTAIPQSSPSKWVRCWHAAQDGWDTRKTFHSQCDGKKATVTIVRVGQYIFGGFTDKSWFIVVHEYYWSSKSFLFSLYNTNGFNPVQLNLTGTANQHAFYGNRGHGPIFGSGHDLYIANLASSGKTSYTKTSTVYQPAPGCRAGVGCTFFAGSHYFQPDDIEVFYYNETISLENSKILTEHGNSSYLSALNGFLTTAIPQSSRSNWVRCWHAAQDGWDIRKTFHSQCDGKKATVTIVRVGQYIFGGFTDKSWFSLYVSDWKSSSKAFLFSLYNIKGFHPIQLNLTGTANRYAFYATSNYGPTFGSPHYLYIANFASSNKNSYTTGSNTYKHAPGCSHGSACTFFAGSHKFQPDDIEVFYDSTINTLQNSKILTDHGNPSYLSALNGFLTTAIPLSSPSNWVRCWHAAQDGWDTRKTFHPQCDGKKATVTIVRVGQYIFGGFTDKSWFGSVNEYHLSSKSFLFSLYNTNGFHPVQLNLTGTANQYAFYGNAGYGPTFGTGHYLYIANLASSGKKSYTTTSSVYQPAPGCTAGAACTFFTGSHYFQPDDIEVFFKANEPTQ